MDKVLIVGALLAGGFLLMRNANAGEASPLTAGGTSAGSAGGGGSSPLAGLGSMLGSLLTPKASAPSYPVSSDSVASAATATPSAPTYSAPAPKTAPAPVYSTAPAPNLYDYNAGPTAAPNWNNSWDQLNGAGA